MLEAAVVTPGLIDAHATVGFSGILNQPHDQDQLEHSTAIQPELRAIDAYNAQDDLIEWIRGFGITTIHTGHAPGELISGQTLIVKTTGNTVADALVRDAHAVAATLSTEAKKSDGKSPGTRGKMMAMLRAELIKAREYQAKQRKAERPSDPSGTADTAKEAKKPADLPPRNLRMDTLVQVLEGKLVLLITADRVQDIQSALRLAKEFDIKIVLDSAAEAFLAIDDIKAAGVPVILHPSMARAVADRENLRLRDRGKAGRGGRARRLAEWVRRIRAEDAGRAFRGGANGRQWADGAAGPGDDHDRRGADPGHCRPRRLARDRQGWRPGSSLTATRWSTPRTAWGP